MEFCSPRTYPPWVNKNIRDVFQPETVSKGLNGTDLDIRDVKSSFTKIICMSFRLFWNFGASQTSITSILWTVRSELGRHGQEFGHELVSESVSEADSDTRFSETLDTDLDKVTISEMGSDTDLDTHKT